MTKRTQLPILAQWGNAAGVTELCDPKPAKPTFGHLSRTTAFTLLLIAAAIRLPFLPMTTEDQLTFLRPWLSHAEAVGPAYLRASFTNYAPFYEHALAGLALLPGPEMLRIKLFSILFELMLAAAVARLVPPDRRLTAFLMVLALPTVVLNSAMFGQADAIYAAPVILALFFAVTNRPIATMLATSLALAIKLQAIMFLPFLVLLVLERRQPLWTFLLLPVAYFAFALPMLLAGRPLSQLVFVYVGQFGAASLLSLRAPNPWAVIQNFVSDDTGLLIGLPFALATACIAVLALWRSGIAREREGLLLSAALLLILVPYVTPKMHERFFFMVDPVLVILACSYRGYALPLILAQLGSLGAYVSYISESYGQENWFFGAHGYLQRHLSIGWGAFLAFGVICMTLAVALLIRKAWQLSPITREKRRKKLSP